MTAPPAEHTEATRTRSSPKRAKSDPTRRIYALLVFIVLEMSIFALFVPDFWTQRNLVSTGRLNAVVAIVAIGVTFGLISGAIDISVGAVIALSGVVGGQLLGHGFPAPLAALGTVAAGTLAGLTNGFFVTRFRVHPLIVTIGMLSVARGLAFVLADGRSVIISDDFFNVFQSKWFGVPLPVLLAAVAFLVGHYVLAWTHFGRYTYAMGGNDVAARAVALPVDRLRTYYLGLSGGLAGLGGWVLASAVGASVPSAARGTELVVITAVLLGGVGFSGGSGNLLGTFLGVVLIGTMVNGMALQGLGPSHRLIVLGLALILPLALEARKLEGFSWRTSAT